MNIFFLGIADGSIDLKEAVENDVLLKQVVGFSRSAEVRLELMKATPSISVPALTAGSQLLTTCGQACTMSAQALTTYSNALTTAAQTLEPLKNFMGIFSRGQSLATGVTTLRTGAEALTTTGQICKNTGDVLTATGTFLNTVKVISTAAVVTSVATTMIDLTLLIRDWRSEHPTIERINDITVQLREEIKCFEEFLRSIDSYKEQKAIRKRVTYDCRPYIILAHVFILLYFLFSVVHMILHMFF